MKGHRLGLVLLVLLLAGVTKLTAQNPVPDVPDGSSIVFGKDQPVANPNGEKFKLSASGTYTIGAGEALAPPYITFGARPVGTKVAVIGAADYLKGNWGATLPVAPGQYQCRGVMYTHTGDPTKATHVKTDVVVLEVK
jgi:hypothetical protein